MTAVQMKLIWGLVWVKKQRPLKMVPMGTKAGFPLLHQLMDPFCKDLPGLLLKSLYHCGPDIFIVLS
jgi:hypothetical protein